MVNGIIDENYSRDPFAAIWGDVIEKELLPHTAVLHCNYLVLVFDVFICAHLIDLC